MSVVGLDFGNQNAVIAAAGRGGVDVILNGNSNRLNAYVYQSCIIVWLLEYHEHFFHVLEESLCYGSRINHYLNPSC